MKWVCIAWRLCANSHRGPRSGKLGHFVDHYSTGHWCWINTVWTINSRMSVMLFLARQYGCNHNERYRYLKVLFDDPYIASTTVSSNVGNYQPTLRRCHRFMIIIIPPPPFTPYISKVGPFLQILQIQFCMSFSSLPWLFWSSESSLVLTTN